MVPVILAALVLGALALPPQPSRLQVSPSSRSYNGGSYIVSSNDIVDGSASSYSGNSYNTDYSSSYTSNYGTDNSDYSSRYTSSYGNDNSDIITGQPYSYSQDRYHPTTYEEDSHKGEIVLPSLNSDSRPSATQDTVVSASDLQDSYLQSTDSFGPEQVAQGSDSFGTQLDSFSSASDQIPKPSNQYLPAPTPPPPPPEPEPEEQKTVQEYTYYYLGPKLWIFPIFFLIYITIYIGVLILRAVYKHKILFPEQLYNASTTVLARKAADDLDHLTAYVTKQLAAAALKYLRRRAVAALAGDKTVMFPVLLAAFVLSSGATGLSSTEEALKGRSYSNDGYRANNFAVPSPPPVPGTRSLYSNPYLTNGYNGGDTSFQNRDSNSYRDSSMYDRNSNPYVSDYRTTNNEGYFQPQSKNTYSFAQDRFHPTTFDVDSHKGEIILPPLDTDNVVQDTVGSSSDVQSFFLRPSNNFLTQPVGQGSDVSTVQDPSPSSSVQEQQFAYQIPLPNYDYQPPPPAQTPYYYYQPPSPPSNLYLPEPSPPPPPPPPPEDEREVNYTYYYLGPKLWYIPLLFSVYYVIYVGALIVKSIARHKLLFPININNAASSLAGRRGRDLEEITARVTRALATAALKYLRQTNISKVAEKTKHNT
ncbi:uncharacterized protein LOC124363700 [Homalodisca vitripennis]|uniref:uncharacterized protein LOC124363700 n=1 Tax=Homalodisca vitripennis TaxID=197043 RepID=UPI001EEBF10C|nr:uncharacterized protein LOC124363700 [Homalodisca vitripennis]